MELNFLVHDLRALELVPIRAGPQFPPVFALVLAFDQRFPELVQVRVNCRVAAGPV